MDMTINNFRFDFESGVYIMGILNITPDSFYDGGKHYDTGAALDYAMKLKDLGADIIDIGGESTRPGAKEVSMDEELSRVIPVIERLRKVSEVVISIDTYKSGVAEEALKNGAKIINDISGLTFDPEMVSIAEKYDVPVVIQHIKGIPKNMQNNPVYENVTAEIKQFFIERIKFAQKHNINKIILDPGIGFGKKKEHNLEIIANLSIFKDLGYPILIGVSRKRFIGEILNVEPDDRVFGTASAVALSVYNGANILRVHDVKEMWQVARVANEIKKNRNSSLIKKWEDLTPPIS